MLKIIFSESLCQAHVFKKKHQIIKRIMNILFSLIFFEFTDVMEKKCEQSITTVQGQTVCKDTLIFSEEFDDNLKKWNYETRFPLDTRDGEFVIYEKRSETSFIKNNNLIIKPEILTNVLDFDDRRIRGGTYNLGDDCTPVENHMKECEKKAKFGRIIPPITSAFLNTRDKFSFQFGRVEIRAKLPVGDWIYPRKHKHNATM
jgi:hypothetical protein